MGSILGRYKDDEHKKEQFPKDCVTIATMQNIYAPQLQKLGVIDEVIWEQDGENCHNFPDTAHNISAFLEKSLDELQARTCARLSGSWMESRCRPRSRIQAMHVRHTLDRWPMPLTKPMWSAPFQ